MRRFIHIFTAVTFLFTFACCEGELDYDKDDDAPNSEEIILPAGNFISFHADVNSRTSLQTSQYITEPFGVYGYQYDFSKTWDAQRVLATPNVFWNLDSIDERLPLKVSYDNGIYNYAAQGADGETMDTNTKQVNWTSNRYAFWAYYPYEGYDSLYFNVSSMTSKGAPYVTYTVDRTTTENMYDVMTGGISQITAANSGNTVTFTMYHRLSAVDVSISNVYEHEYVVEGVNHIEDVDIIIKDLKLTFNNLKYSSAKIFLEQNKNIPALNTVLTTAADMRATYQLVGTNSDIAASDTITPTTTVKTNLTADNGATMTFIPQETDSLSVTVTGSYYIIGVETQARVPHLRVNEEGEPVDKSGKKTNDPTRYVYDGVADNDETGAKSTISVVKTTDFNQPLVEGTRYYIVLNFTSKAVSINIIKAEAWDDKTVDYEFM